MRGKSWKYEIRSTKLKVRRQKLEGLTAAYFKRRVNFIASDNQVVL